MGSVIIRIYRMIGLELLWVLSELGFIGLKDDRIKECSINNYINGKQLSI